MWKPKSVLVNMHGTSQEFKNLNVCELNSMRKRMSTVVRCPDGKIKLFCKGADTVILDPPRCGPRWLRKLPAHAPNHDPARLLVLRRRPTQFEPKATGSSQRTCSF